MNHLSSPADTAPLEDTVLDMIRVGSFFGLQPSLREMNRWLGYTTARGGTSAGARGALDRLEARGLISRHPGRNRAIELVGPQPGWKARRSGPDSQTCSTNGVPCP